MAWRTVFRDKAGVYMRHQNYIYRPNPNYPVTFFYEGDEVQVFPSGYADPELKHCDVYSPGRGLENWLCDVEATKNIQNKQRQPLLSEQKSNYNREETEDYVDEDEHGLFITYKGKIYRPENTFRSLFYGYHPGSGYYEDESLFEFDEGVRITNQDEQGVDLPVLYVFCTVPGCPVYEMWPEEPEEPETHPHREPDSEHKAVCLENIPLSPDTHLITDEYGETVLDRICTNDVEEMLRHMADQGYIQKGQKVRVYSLSAGQEYMV